MSRFEIEKFPESESAKRMLRRVSPIYDNSYVGKWLYEVMGREFDEASKLVLSLRDQIFTGTVTWGLEFQEDKYSLDHDTSLTLDERRARLYRRKSLHSPLSPWFLENYIKEAWGITVDIDETYANGVILLTIPFIKPEDNLIKMYKDLRRIKPSHLSVTVLHQINGSVGFYYGGAVSSFGEISIKYTWKLLHIAVVQAAKSSGVVQIARRIAIVMK